MSDREWRLAEISRLLAEPQHRLIYLCEHGIIAPDHGDASGRGSSRRFSSRNILEFAVALEMRSLSVSTAVIAAVLSVLRSLERKAGSESPGFKLPDSLRDRDAPDLRIVISDGSRLFFALRQTGSEIKVFGGLALADLEERPNARVTLDIASVDGGRATSWRSFGFPEGSERHRLELSVTRVAQELDL